MKNGKNFILKTAGTLSPPPQQAFKTLMKKDDQRSSFLRIGFQGNYPLGGGIGGEAPKVFI